MAQFNFEGIGTNWQIDIYKELTREQESEILLQIKNRIEIFDKDYSRFREDSLITKISKNSGIFKLPLDAEPIMKLYYDLYLKTEGLFTPLIGNLISDAGYDATYSLKQKKHLENPPAWEEVMSYENNILTVKKPVLLDFGAGGKGYLVDLVAKVLEENGIYQYCIDAGGDILHKNNTPISIGLENPNNTSEVIGIYNLQNKSICGSAHNRRTWGKWSHIINPKNLSSPKNISAVWVIADTAILADCLATCLFFIPASTLIDIYKFEYLIIKDDHSVEKSSIFLGEIFTQ